jgi:hypothetical protein
MQRKMTIPTSPRTWAKVYEAPVLLVGEGQSRRVEGEESGWF